MANDSLLRQEVEDYVNCCKRLMPPMFADRSFTAEEQGAIQFYLDELTGLHAAILWIPMCDYRPTVWDFIRASEALLALDNLSSDEVETIEYWADKLTVELLYSG
jgi:hypothetical protein